MLFKAFSLNKKKDSVCFRNCTWLSRSRKISRIISRVFFFFKVLFTWKSSSSREWQSSIGNQPREWQFSRSKFQLERDSKCIVKCTYSHLWGLLPSLTIIEHDHYFFFLFLFITLYLYFILLSLILYRFISRFPIFSRNWKNWDIEKGNEIKRLYIFVLSVKILTYKVIIDMMK